MQTAEFHTTGPVRDDGIKGSGGWIAARGVRGRGSAALLVAVMALSSGLCRAQAPVAHWGFDQVLRSDPVREGGLDGEARDARAADHAVRDAAAGIDDRLTGNFKLLPGIRGKGLRFDGFETRVLRAAGEAPRLGDRFTVEAWVALAAYPWNWNPIVAQASYEEVEHPSVQQARETGGYYFGVDSEGCVGLRMMIAGEWVECVSEKHPDTRLGLELRRWRHIAGVYDADRGLAVYIDGKESARSELQGAADFAFGAPLLIGRNGSPKAPTFPVRNWATYPSGYSWDGMIDEVKIHARALSPAEIMDAAGSADRPAPPLPPRHFPAVANEGTAFKAYERDLVYYEQWDALWEGRDLDDVVIQFDRHPVNMVFWRGTRFSPCWVTENGKWMADQSREVVGNWHQQQGEPWKYTTGCVEHMSDAECRYSRARIVENNAARIVVLWRYAQMDVLYRHPNSHAGNEPLIAREMYYVYPDAVGVRRVLPGKGGWQETIFLNAPGTRPEDNCEDEAVTQVDLAGNVETYTWKDRQPKIAMENPAIQMTNLKSEYRPFIILPDGSHWKTFSGEVRRKYSSFPWWNHWPVAQVKSDGRRAIAPDRASHSSLAWGFPSKDVALYGLTDGSAASLLPLARSWIAPPGIEVAGDGVEGARYDEMQRAYVIELSGGAAPLAITLAASEESPVFNPAFVIKGWGDASAALDTGGRRVEPGADFRIGHEGADGARDLVCWIRIESQQPVRLGIGRGSTPGKAESCGACIRR